MGHTIDIDAAEKALKDTTDRYDSLSSHIYGVDNEISLLLHLKKILEANIATLKDRQIITIAVEYKKARDDLRKVYGRLHMLRINKNNLVHSLEQARKFMIECRTRYIHALETQTAKVIEIDFRKKHDRQDGNST